MKAIKLLKSLFKYTLISIVTFAGIVFSINLFVVYSTKNNIYEISDLKDLNADCIIVLGAGVLADKSPSNMLEDRLIYGIALFENNAGNKLLMSGDNGQQYYDEVNVMKNYAIDKGVKSSDVFMDHAGFSTYESIYRAKEIFGVEEMVIVTQEYHLYRALYIADKFGIKAYGVPSNPREYSFQYRRDIREIFARNKDFIMSILKPDPTFLGEIIPIGGDGDVTNDK